MLNTKHLLTSLTLTAVIVLAGCFPGVYKIDIQQGNVVTQDMIDELRPGMSKAQVRYIMGNPLITDTFHARRWDYLYSLQTGSGEKSQKRMSLYFNDGDQLIAVSGDFRLKPGKTRDEAILGTQANAESITAPPITDNSAELPGEPEPAAQETPLVSQQPPATENTEKPSLQFSDNRSMEPGAPPPGSLEEQIQHELDAAKPIQQQQPGQL
ncbi:hypothetical protein AXE65_10930 [Ventosimonas gracilis]|uniref:Outer membrane protein assembly factor BamE n=1 Tax=Ventosimonas gracilis TaxID=1680762 RepID=A0A139SWH9_9GAMM|nr:outer membrane protein assembly factor BamE [Ventosimonas gracilis]KXU38953.1 hypothetical protein AXE65_10930 [Ventosimonas gracilis]